MCREPMNEGAVKCAHCGATRVTTVKSWVSTLWALIFIGLALVGCRYSDEYLGEGFLIMMGWVAVLPLLIKFGPQYTFYRSSI